MDAVPTCKAKVLSFIDKARSAGPSLDLNVLLISLDTLLEARETWKSVQDYGIWIHMFKAAQPTAAAMISSSSSLESKGDEKKLGKNVYEIGEKIEQLSFLFTFLRDVAVPLKIAPDITANTLKVLDQGQLRTSKALCSVIKMFSTLRFKIIGADEDFKCPLSLEEIKDPVILKGDGRTYERKECFAFFAKLSII
eukprot:1340357-Amorphochlora_amoeboformis.AAC.1